MKQFSIADQINACIKHANRNNRRIHSVEIHMGSGANHQAIVTLDGPYFPDGIPYISLAILMRRNEEQCCNESTWDVGRN